MRYIPIYFLLLISIIFLTDNSSSSLIAEQINKSKPALAGEPCKIKPLKDWSPQEKWVWMKVCQGEIANFNKAEGYGGELDPRKEEDWQKDQQNRILRSTFLETILLIEPYRSTLHRNGVHIVGAWFIDSVDLSSSRLDHPLWLDKCRFEKDVDLVRLYSNSYIFLMGSKFKEKLNMYSIDVKGSIFMIGEAEFDKEVNLVGAKIGGHIAMMGSKFNGKLNMNGIEVKGQLLMRDGDIINGYKFETEFEEVNLIGAKIGGQIAMTGSKFNGKLNMDGIEVKNGLFMTGEAEFEEVRLRGAKIGDQIAMIGSKFNGILDMDSMEVKRHLLMRDGDLKMDGHEFETEFEEVALHNAKIGGLIDMTGSKFNGKLNMNGIEVKSHLYMYGEAEVTTTIPVTVRFADIGGSLHLSGSILHSLDLTGTHIRQELNLYSEKFLLVQWAPESKLTLRNTVAGALVDHPEAWPDNLELDGFTYAQLGRFGGDNKNDIDSRDVSNLIKWIEKDKSYSPQPYKQLASVLAKEGHKGKARDILYYGKKHEQSEAKGIDKLFLSLSYIFIGYGYRVYIAGIWALGFIILGMSILYFYNSGPKMRTTPGFWNKTYNHIDKFFYSLDMLLPIIKLNEGHKDILLPDGVRYYFYVHHMMGYVLGFFLIAGLSGLVVK